MKEKKRSQVKKLRKEQKKEILTPKVLNEKIIMAKIRIADLMDDRDRHEQWLEDLERDLRSTWENQMQIDINLIELYYSLTERIERLESEIYYKSPVIIGLVIGLGILFLQLPLVLGVETSLDWFLLVVGIGFILSWVREFFR